MKIKLNLSEKSIDNAIRQIERYQLTLADKTAEFVERLALLGIPVIQQNMDVITGDADTSHDTNITVTSNGNTSKAVLKVSGKDLYFIEFGAGVFHNGHPHSSPHPKGEEMGMTIGDYSEKHLGLNNGWWYTDENGESHYSRGTQASMPMYKASQEIIQNIRKIAKEVFES